MDKVNMRDSFDTVITFAIGKVLALLLVILNINYLIMMENPINLNRLTYHCTGILFWTVVFIYKLSNVIGGTNDKSSS